MSGLLSDIGSGLSSAGKALSSGAQSLEKGVSNLFGRSGNIGNNSIINDFPPTPPAYSEQTKHDFNPRYALYLQGQDEEGTEVKILAAMPEQLGIHITADWQSLLSQSDASSNIGGLSSRLGNLAGASASIIKALTGQTDTLLIPQIWHSSSPVDLSIPFQFNAVLNARQEVMDQLETLLKLVSPSLNSLHTLRAPGPTLNVGFRNLTKYHLTLHYGQTYTFDNIIVTGVSANPDSMFTVSGEILSCQVDVSIRTTTVLTKADISKIFGKPKTGAKTPAGFKPTNTLPKTPGIMV